ncbi:MAG TPA: ABC transporter ATP-binding protein [Leptospiraceae bacterium]|nr:ABC transporter ATP-binding protein [Leptospiraceae bacterium]HMW04986.1 ABC transporter ATP-binding protein [Leptospiraceae bacterium]HMX33877.1 ABC transporter ATP-binding protein [Leptospiraceae bacterium]HMY30793.1 ABC transporter ATP-binding protein [Leptospiraceae bacterium]HMZ66374.1 ABC transporter ATP-binding protein [Leptospiraceae bacterium]
MNQKIQSESFNMYALRILEKFAESDGVEFDSVKTLTEIESYTRKKKLDQTSLNLSDLVSIAEKLKIYLNIEISHWNDIIQKVSPSSPVAIYLKEEGWLFIHGVFGPLVRCTRVSDSSVFWTLKRNIVNKIQSSQDNGDYPQWLILKKKFSVLGKDYHSSHDYLSSIFRFIRIEKKDIWAIAIYSVAIGLFSLIIPMAVQSLVNILNFGTLFQPVLILTLIVIIALGFVGYLNVLQAYVAELIQQRLFLRLAANVVTLLPRVNYASMKKYYGSEIPNYFLDISIIQKSATILLTSGLGIFLQTIIGLLVLVLYHPIFILFNVIILGFVIGIIFYLIGSVGIETSIKESKSKHKLASWIQEMNFHPMMLRSANSREYATLRSENLAREYLTARRKHFKALIRQMIGFVSLQALGSGLLLGIGGWLVIKGQITLGQLVASEIIVSKILDNFGKLTKYLENYYDLCASVDKVNHLLDFETEVEGDFTPEIQKDTPISVHVENLNFNTGDIWIEKFTANKGEIIQIQDASKVNAMKFMEILNGLNVIESGKLELDSYNIKDINLSELRNHVLLLRDLDIFSGTISENLTLGKWSYDPKEIRMALAKVGLDGKVDQLPDGIATDILRNGYPFRKEELALFCIARIFITKPSLILIDNILIYLSKESLQKVLGLLKECKDFATIIIASNLPEIQKLSDRTYIFKDQNLVESRKEKNV